LTCLTSLTDKGWGHFTTTPHRSLDWFPDQNSRRTD
jgi:hypothetical protein